MIIARLKDLFTLTVFWALVFSLVVNVGDSRPALEIKDEINFDDDVLLGSSYHEESYFKVIPSTAPTTVVPTSHEFQPILKEKLNSFRMDAAKGNVV